VIRAFVRLLLFAASFGAASCGVERDTPLRRACAYLKGQQGEDGGWHSETYGLARSGQAYTPFVLDAILAAAERDPAVPLPDVEAALEFIRRHTNDEGVLGMADPDVPEYPNYATAFAVRVLSRVGRDSEGELLMRMRERLAFEQFAPATGFDPSVPVFGSWGFGGPRPLGSPGHVDLSHTRHVLQALRSSGLEDPDVYERAQAFLRFLQRHPDDGRPQPPDTEPAGRAVPYDGGFYFSPVVLEANKGGLVSSDGGSYFASYATATADGVLALLAAGVAPSDERVLAARSWLERHPRLDYPEGVPAEDPESFGEAIYFYHLAARAEAYEALDWPGDWRSAVTRELARLQREDGSFVNDRSHLMKEDDPLIATTLAVLALTPAAGPFDSHE
jgi:hypothetical protein